MIERVLNWLNGKRNFNIGKVLYIQIGTDENIKALLQFDNAGITAEQLAVALTEWCKAEEAKQTAAQSFMPASDDDVLNAIRSEWLPKYKRMAYLCQTLDQFGTSNTAQAIAARDVIAFEILDLEMQCTAAWSNREHYLKHGTLPQLINHDNEDQQLPSDLLEAAKFMENIKRNIRRNKLQMEKKDAQPQYVFLFHHYNNLFKN